MLMGAFNRDFKEITGESWKNGIVQISAEVFFFSKSETVIMLREISNQQSISAFSTSRTKLLEKVQRNFQMKLENSFKASQFDSLAMSAKVFRIYCKNIPVTVSIIFWGKSRKTSQMMKNHSNRCSDEGSV